MQVLEAELKRLEAEYNMFFGGRLPRLPWESRARVEALVRRHDRGPKLNTAERFRFQSLQSRFSSFCELWDRTLRAREEGRPDRRRPGRPAAGTPGPESAVGASPRIPAPSPTPASEKADQILAEASVRDLAKDADRVRQLYEQLTDARRAVGEHAVPFERFERLVGTQLARLGAEGKPVAFRVTLKDGKVSLTAKSAKGR